MVADTVHNITGEHNLVPGTKLKCQIVTMSLLDTLIVTNTTVKQCKSVRSSDTPRQQLKQHLAAAGSMEVVHSHPFLALHSPHLPRGECFSRRVVQGGGIGF